MSRASIPLPANTHERLRCKPVEKPGDAATVRLTYSTDPYRMPCGCLRDRCAAISRRRRTNLLDESLKFFAQAADK